jgi:glycolate oxidase iron-sulfur subunit
MLDVAPAWRSGERPPAVTAARDEKLQAARRVGLLTGCVQSVLFGDVNTATARVLAAAGYEVVAPPQGCCGALSAHAGRRRSRRDSRSDSARASPTWTRSS